jgi:hypothetical protein
VVLSLQQYNGEIIDGTFFQQDDEFSITQIKHFETESILNKNQLNILEEYLKKQLENQHGCIVTINDQLLVPLANNEIQLLIKDLQNIQQFF